MSFCSRECLAAGEPTPGTGVRGQAYLLLPVAKRVWRDGEFNTAWAQPEELEAIRVARRAGVVTRLYNPQPDVQAAFVYTGPTRPVGLAPLLEVIGRRFTIVEDAAPRLAVCTQGTRDRCCAKWGYRVFRQALGLYREGRFPFQPLECSHLGGDRFAATGILFPSGSMYAHLDTADLPALGAAEAAGQLLPAEYRGRVYDPPLAQVARAGLAQQGLLNDATTPLQVRERSPETLEVVAPERGLAFQVSLQIANLSFYGSCDKLEAHTRAHGRRPVFEAAQAEPLPA